MEMLAVLRNEFPVKYRKAFSQSMAAQAISISDYYEKEGKKWLSFRYFLRSWRLSDNKQFNLLDVLSKLKKVWIR
jgi:hypothetical protein